MSRLEHPDRLKIEEYRAKAIEALEQATRTKDPAVRTSWEFIATSYHDMAERLERRVKT
jgi:16S rRNA U1498 N3-methylase RsmE